MRKGVSGRWLAIIAGVLVVLVVGLLLLRIPQRVVRTLRGVQTVGGNPGVAYLRLPPGFQAEVYASGLRDVRFIAVGPDGVLYAAERGANAVVALPVDGPNGQARRVVVADGLEAPTSLAFDGRTLYVGETTRVTRMTIGANFRGENARAIITDLPPGGQHTTRTVLLGADGRLYVSTGSSCNVCDESDPHRAAVWVYNADGSGGRLYARGLRNAVGLAVNPVTRAVWATNNGRDYLGDNAPPETVYALQDGAAYGWPRCHAGNIIDPDMGRPGDCDGVGQPVVTMQAHSAPLGLAFYSATRFPAEYRGLYIALHGSWNRSSPVGYKVVFVPLTADGTVAGAPRDFATGWLSGNGAVGRPVGLAVGPDGALYVSDDKAGMIYRITYTG